jgi:hypothetical protein
MSSDAKFTKRLAFILAVYAATEVQAAPILTEIHYNGASAGSDPDEFIEISNSSTEALDLSGFSFSSGISFVFPEGSMIEPLGSLVIARDPDDFRSVFAGFTDSLFDFTGALSNGGETLALSDVSGAGLWSVSYDDAFPWPAGADGTGESLQLATNSTDFSSPSAWFTALPTPGRWAFADRPAQPPTNPVPAPMPLVLTALGLMIMGTRPRRYLRR